MRTLSVGVVVGEDADLSPTYVKENGIVVYDFQLNWDGVIEDRSNLYKSMRDMTRTSESQTPHTSQPSVGYFKKLFEASLKKHDEIIVVTISSFLSGCFNSAVQAAKLIDQNSQKNVHILDSHLSTGGTALIVMQILEDIKARKNITTIFQQVKELRSQVHIRAMIEDSYWLQKGGRISPAIAMIINQMKKIGVRPILGTNQGRVKLYKVRAKAQNKVQGLFEFISEEIADKRAALIITHADNDKEAQLLEKMFKKISNIKVLYAKNLSPVFGAHVGPDTLVVSWRFVD